MIRRISLFLLVVVIVPLAGCQTTRSNQKWPMLSEYPRPEVAKVSKVELMEVIDAMPAGEARERVKLLATEVIDDLAESWRDFVYWGDRMDAVIEQYNKEAKKHNKRVAVSAVGFDRSFLATESTVESRIVSDFNGLGHGNIYKLANGQVWRQTEYWIFVRVWVWPDMLIWEENGIYKMKVEGIDHVVTVVRIR